MASVSRRVLPGFSLSLGYTLFYLSALVLIPLGACFVKAASLTPSQFVAAVVSSRLRYRRSLWMTVAIAERLLFVPAALLAVWPGAISTETQLWLFIGSTALQFAISVIGVLVFVGLTAYDTQRIKEIYLESDDSETMGKKALMGALSLYLDFINLFILLMQLFGQRRE